MSVHRTPVKGILENPYNEILGSHEKGGRKVLKYMQQTASSTVRGKHNKAQKMSYNMFLFNTHPLIPTCRRSTQQTGSWTDSGERRGTTKGKAEERETFTLWLVCL